MTYCSSVVQGNSIENTNQSNTWLFFSLHSNVQCENRNKHTRYLKKKKTIVVCAQRRKWIRKQTHCGSSFLCSTIDQYNSDKRISSHEHSFGVVRWPCILVVVSHSSFHLRITKPLPSVHYNDIMHFVIWTPINLLLIWMALFAREMQYEF